MATESVSCSNCLAEIDEDDAQKCETCGWDGLCQKCLETHSCEESPSA